MLQYIRPYRRAALTAVGLLALASLCELTIPRLIQYVIDQGITPGDMSAVLRGTGIMVGVTLIGAVASVAQAIFVARFSQGMAFDLRNDLFRRVQTLSFGNLDKLQTGQLITRLSSDVEMMRMFAGMGTFMITRAVFYMLGSLTLLVITDWQLSLIMLVIIPLMAILFTTFANAARPMFLLVQQKLADLNTVVQENLAGVEVVKAFVREHFEIARFGQRNDIYRDQQIRVGRLMSAAFPIIMLIGNLGTLAVIWMGGMQVIGGRLTVGELVAFNDYLLTTMFPLVMLGMVLTMLSAAGASAERVAEVLDMEPQVASPAEPRALPAVKGQVVFDDVSFHYNGDASMEVLRDINFSVAPGEQVALMGATGSGKSTLINLIPRFYDATEGRVLIDGMDVRELSPQELRARIGIVLQQTTLFSGTVRENIAYGRPEASLEEVIAAAQAAQAHEFIMSMPEGYDSMVEARGANLSGGQKQRIAIARALLIDPSILILDDSTSAVDMETEYEIQQALAALKDRCTTFIIAQRISSVLDADKIVVLDRGRVTAIGPHEELVHSSPIYREIFRSQMSEQADVIIGQDGRH